MPGQDPPDPASQRKTCHRYNDPDHAHALTFSCFQRRPFLSRDRSRQWLIDAIKQAKDKHRFNIRAYVIMPEHVHLLIYPTVGRYDIGAILKSIKQPVANRAIAYVRRNVPDFLARMRDEGPGGKVSHRFWQRGGGYDRNLWSPSYLWETINYIHDNQVRRGLCDDPIEWYWSSASQYLGGPRGPMDVWMDELPDDPRNLNRRRYL